MTITQDVSTSLASSSHCDVDSALGPAVVIGVSTSLASSSHCDETVQGFTNALPGVSTSLASSSHCDRWLPGQPERAVPGLDFSGVEQPLRPGIPLG
mgnify:CR=1 FL=1